MPYAKEFVENLAQVIDLSEIDYIVANHGEVDHSGLTSTDGENSRRTDLLYRKRS